MLGRPQAPISGQPQPLGAVVETLRGRSDQVVRVGKPAREPSEVQPVLAEQPRKAGGGSARFEAELGRSGRAARVPPFQPQRSAGSARAGRSRVVDQGRIGARAPPPRSAGSPRRPRARHDLLVERHQILEACRRRDGNDNRLRPRHRAVLFGKAIEAGDGGGHLSCPRLPLERPLALQPEPGAESGRRKAVQDIADHTAPDGEVTKCLSYSPAETRPVSSCARARTAPRRPGLPADQVLGAV